MAKLGIDEVLEKPCWVIDILPERVPEDSEGQYFTIEKYYRREPQVSLLRRKFADVVVPQIIKNLLILSFNFIRHMI